MAQKPSRGTSAAAASGGCSRSGKSGNRPANARHCGLSHPGRSGSTLAPALPARAQRSARVLRWAEDQVRIGTERDNHVRQGLLQARRRRAHGSVRRGHGAGAVASRLRALQRRASALVLEHAFTQRVLVASGRSGAPVTRGGRAVTLRLERVRGLSGQHHLMPALEYDQNG